MTQVKISVSEIFGLWSTIYFNTYQVGVKEKVNIYIIYKK